MAAFLTEEQVLKSQRDALFVRCTNLPVAPVEVQGFDFNNGVDYSAILHSFKHFGFQATYLGEAIAEVEKMLAARKEPVSPENNYDFYEKPYPRKKTGCTIFLGYTSNMISCGMREIFRFLMQHNLVDCVVTTAGGIEEDFIKCLGPTYIGSFYLSGKELRNQGVNRIGNLLVPNDNYCKFENWIMPILDQMLVEQTEQGVKWTPSKVINRLGKEINDERSVYYWAYKNNIPIFSPALTDGSIGDMLYFHSCKNRQNPLVLDIIEDVVLIDNMTVQSQKSGVLILGGGVIKHHILNANLMRNGADFAVYINTAQEFDGSDGGARPDEAISWGKIKIGATPVKLICDATIAFPLLVAETFAKEVHGRKRKFHGETNGVYMNGH